jgi:Ca2+-binding EF-hand superfamily protein
MESLEVYLTCDELSCIFNFIDNNEDGVIDNYEFVEFFMPSLPAYEY